MVVAHGDLAHWGVQHVVATHKTCDEFGGGLVVDLVGAAHLFDVALVHHHHGVGQCHRFFLRVGDVDEGEAQLLLPAAQLGTHLDAQEGVECGQRLVQQQYTRLRDERPRQRHTLLLAARQFTGFALCQVAHGHTLQQVLCLGLAFGFTDTFHLQAEGHVVERREVWEQRKTLEHHGRAPAGRGQVGDVAVVQQDVATAHRLVPRNHAQRGAFAAARRPEQAAVTAAGDFEVDAVHRDAALRVTLGQGDEFNGGAGVCGGVHKDCYAKPVPGFVCNLARRMRTKCTAPVQMPRVCPCRCTAVCIFVAFPHGRTGPAPWQYLPFAGVPADSHRDDAGDITPSRLIGTS